MKKYRVREGSFIDQVRVCLTLAAFVALLMWGTVTSYPM